MTLGSTVDHLSSTEVKLLHKIVLLARTIHEASLRTNVSHNVKLVSVRKRLLLVSLLKIGKALRVEEQLFKTDRFINILSIMAQLPFSLLDKIFAADTTSPLSEIMRQAHMALQLKYILLWKSRLHTFAHKPLPASIISTNVTDPFCLVLHQRMPLVDGLKNFRTFKSSRYLILWRDKVRHRLAVARFTQICKRRIFEKWHYASQLAQTAKRFDRLNCLNRAFRNWSLGTRDVRHELAQVSNVFAFNRINNLPLHHSSFIIYRIGQAVEFCAKAREWARLRHALQARQAVKFYRRHLGKAAVQTWLSALDFQRGMQKSSQLYHETCTWRKFFYLWLNRSISFLSSELQIKKQISNRQKDDCFDHWKYRMRERVSKRQLFYSWRAKAEFQSRITKIGVNFNRRLQALNAIVILRKCVDKRSQRTKELQTRLVSFDKKRFSTILSKWRSKTDYNIRQIGLVDSWRANQQSVYHLRMWKRQVRGLCRARKFNKTAIKMHFWPKLRKLTQQRITERSLKLDFFQKWKQCLQTVRSLRTFLMSRAASSGGGNVGSDRFIPMDLADRISCPDQVVPLMMKRSVFVRWHRAHILNQRCLHFLHGRVFRYARVALKIWRTDLLVRRMDQSDHLRVKERAWNAFKLAVRRIGQKQIVLELKLEEYNSSLNYIRYYRYYKTWESAFQIRKMEEHLCEQNLMAYQVRAKRIIWNHLKLRTLEAYWKRYADTARRNHWLARWRSSGRRVRRDRRHYLLRRTLAAWSTALANRKINERLAILQRRRQSAILNVWRRLTKQRIREYQGRLSDMQTLRQRHYIDLWRMKRAHRRQHAKVQQVETVNEVKQEEEPSIAITSTPQPPSYIRVSRVDPTVAIMSPMEQRLLPIPLQSIGPLMEMTRRPSITVIPRTPGSPRKAVKSVVFSDDDDNVDVAGGDHFQSKNDSLKIGTKLVLCPPPTVAPRRVFPGVFPFSKRPVLN